MQLDTSERYFSYSFDADLSTTDGIGRDDDGSYEVNWDEIEVIDADDVPPRYEGIFETDAFYQFSDVTVAKPIKQQYSYDETDVTLLKPSSELQKSMWSLDGRPWTLDHPETGSVRSYEQIHGVWTDPEWDSDNEDLNATLLFPTEDAEAKAYLEESGDVSVGFLNKLDMDVDSADAEQGIDGYQRDLMYDHVASVQRGRCPSSAGCGVFADNDGSTAQVMRVAENRADVADTSIASFAPERDCECGTSNTNTTMCDNFDLDDYNPSFIRSEHDGVDSLLSEKESQIEDLESEVAEMQDVQIELEGVREALEIDNDVSPSSAVEDFVSHHKETEETLDSYREDEREELEQFLADHGIEMDDDVGIDSLRERKETVKMTIDSLDIEDDETSPNVANDGGGGDEPSSSRTGSFDPRDF